LNILPECKDNERLWSHMSKMRVDLLMVKKGIVTTRETAQRLILAGKVSIGNVSVSKPSQLITEDAEIQIVEGLKYVSRGGLKLEAALDAFQAIVADKIVLDVGASTGGFADCLLQRGARKIYAVDVGYGQLAWKLQQNSQVVIMDRTNARFLTKEMFADSIDLAVIDVSFIGVILILEPLKSITNEIILLLKPQFEAGKEKVPKGGVIRKPETHRKVLYDFFEKLKNWEVFGLIDSPISGGSGNREFLVHLKGASGPGWNYEQFKKRVKELIP
jgi:23S rRNA (cytidine1920-2'-O)/16S rRNA (cytidine1409-2'-O)-methyltransferase